VFFDCTDAAKPGIPRPDASPENFTFLTESLPQGNARNKDRDLCCFSFVFEKNCQGNDGQGNGKKTLQFYSPDHHSSDTSGFSMLHASSPWLRLFLPLEPEGTNSYDAGT
jgi:hypothetical protein